MGPYIALNTNKELMKKILLIATVALATGSATAQQREGRVVYERTMQMQIRLAGMEGAEQMLPRTRTDKIEVLFANNQSLRRQLEDETPDENQFGGNGMQIRVMAAGQDDIVYYNFGEGRLVEQREFATKKYLVLDSISKLSWKLTGQTKTILNQVCQQATTQRITTRMMMNMDNGVMKREEVPDTMNITAWFAPAIPVPAGPEYQGQLPGLIMAIDVNNGRTVYLAVELSPKVEATNIKEPKSGKKVNQEEFRKEREKVMEEMQRNGGGNRRIIRG
jgi:GLPGLI family protein